MVAPIVHLAAKELRRYCYLASGLIAPIDVERSLIHLPDVSISLTISPSAGEAHSVV